MTARARVGISGWTYPGWRGDFYPDGLPQRRELEYAAHRLDTIEINGSFYSLQRPTSYRKWAEQTPDGFVFAVKGGRFITHMRRLADPHASLANFFASGILALGERLGPVLWQLPPTLRFDADLAASFLAELPRTTEAAARLAGDHDDKLSGDRVLAETDEDRPIRHAVEVRHESFADDAAREVFAEHDVALVVADTAGRYPKLFDVTADFVYVRLHGDEELYASGYTDSALREWAGRIGAWTEAGLDVFAYFDNDMKGYAPHDAQRLAELLT
ncbi:DUF72 domain-containing protein [Rhodococcus rhodnii]|uniref:DUF72 domain-containing protein n=2 Tax=Rhodococcus rhodnii TaxID=38312 RepID=R7WP01_9NOCA|nr:DUF72 domain-containing protein [Rhodococcus rhodnii]EOM77046.1 hypothetical protein Rrhod_1666 [Rhodococcus rhodnii LMG 5362]TXG89886.1 DUF72 domain-containing protein [Rhodococcus rhodnii]